MLLQIVVKYQMLINNLERLIETGGFLDGYLSRKIGLKPTDFLLKSKRETGKQSKS
ncbi:MAG: hypothetical protein H7320_23095 [Ferruginibacter sp.]|nr:hypothetical protein [Ferruginibacter sp.]